MSDRMNYDQMARSVGQDSARVLDDEDLHKIDAEQVAREVFEADLAAGQFEDIDDVGEARARFIPAFALGYDDERTARKEAAIEKMTEALDDEIYLKQTGYTTQLIAIPGGQQGGLDYGPIAVKVVVLDREVAFRTETDSQDGDWQIGSTEDAVAACIEERYAWWQLEKENEEEKKMMAEVMQEAGH